MKGQKKETEQARKDRKPVVIYPGPYARFLYYGKLMIDPNTGSSWAPKDGSKVVVADKDLNIRRSTHPQAQAHWFEASKAQNLKKWERAAAEAMKDELDK